MSGGEHGERHGKERRRRERRSSYRRWRQQSWFGIVGVCVLLAGVIALRVMTFVKPVEEDQATELSPDLADSPDQRLRQAFAERNLGRILLACHAAWDRQMGELVPALAMAWQPDQLDLYAAEGNTNWRHYWCRESGVGRGRSDARPANVAGRIPLPSEQLVYRFSGLVADQGLHALEALGDGRGDMSVRLHWNDGRVTGEYPEQPAPDFVNLRLGPAGNATRALTANPS
ncbi:MAG: hypothetical protein KDI48_01690 [Xanthomonadales bacterium]|nr:hypothetical protein [Xanthomonadales bacterium]